MIKMLMCYSQVTEIAFSMFEKSVIFPFGRYDLIRNKSENLWG